MHTRADNLIDDSLSETGASTADPFDVATALNESRATMLGFVRKKISDSVVAEDVLQDSIIKAIKAAPSLREEEKLLPWFYRILNNSITDYYRRHQFEQKTFTQMLDDESGGSVEQADLAVVCQCLHGILSTMKPEYAVLIDELELSDGDPETVAQRMGITRNNLKVRRHRARAQLRERLEQTCRICASHGCLDCSCGSTNRTSAE